MSRSIQPITGNDFCHSQMIKAILALSYCNIWVFKRWLLRSQMADGQRRPRCRPRTEGKPLYSNESAAPPSTTDVLTLRHFLCKRNLSNNKRNRQQMPHNQFWIAMEYFTAEQQLFCPSLCAWRAKAAGNLKNIDQRKSISICQMPAQDYWHLATDIFPETQ